MRAFLLEKLRSLDRSLNRIVSNKTDGDKIVESTEVKIKNITTAKEWNDSLNLILGRIDHCEVFDPKCPTCAMVSKLLALRIAYPDDESIDRHDLRIEFFGNFRFCPQYTIVIEDERHEQELTRLVVKAN